jgi:hypothetical protein
MAVVRKNTGVRTRVAQNTVCFTQDIGAADKTVAATNGIAANTRVSVCYPAHIENALLILARSYFCSNLKQIRKIRLYPENPCPLKTAVFAPRSSPAATT